jgi:hypothetical protein
MTRKRGRVGRSFTKTPSLRNFERSPASEVVVRDLDGNVLRIEAPLDPVKRVKKKRRRK